MPQAIPLIAGGAASTLVENVILQAIIGGLVSYGTTKLLGLDEIPALKDPGITSNVRSTVAGIPIVYGRRQVGGVLCQILTTGNLSTALVASRSFSRGRRANYDEVIDNKLLNFIIAWGEGEIGGVSALWLDDEYALDDKFNVPLSIYIEHHTGTDDQVASPGFLAALARTFVPDSAIQFWSVDHKLSGVAYSFVQLFYRPELWTSGIPQITAEISGLKVAELRNPGQVRWTQNPALIIYDYLTNTRYGRGIDAVDLDAQSFIDAANYCDQDIEFLFSRGGGTVQARYTCNAVLNPDNTCLDNLKLLLTSCRGALIFSGGKYQLRIDKPEVASFNLTEDNIVGGWSIVLESSESQFNEVTAQWVNANNDYQEDLITVSSATFLANDGGEVLTSQIDLPATTNKYRASHLAGIALRQSRYSIQCEVNCTIDGLTCEVFDVVSVTHSVPGWNGQLFRVMGISLESDDQVRLSLLQYADDVYDNYSTNEEDSPFSSSLPDPRFVPGIEIYEIYPFETPQPDGTTRTYFQPVWRSAIDSMNLKGFRLRWREFGVEAPWQFLELPLDAAASEGLLDRYQTIEIDVSRGVTYELEIWCFNRLGVDGVHYENSSLLIGSLPAPAKPTALRAAGYTSGVLLSWTPGADATATEIWRTLASGTFTDYPAVLIATVSGASYLDVLAWGQDCTYWARSVKTLASPSIYYPAITVNAVVAVSGLQVYANDAAAGAAGLLTGDQYLNASNQIVVKI